MFTTRWSSTFTRWIFASCLIAGLAVAGSPTAAVTGSIAVFGTSLSDPGNAYTLTGGTNAPPSYSVDAFLIPDRPYDRGGHHFTNGATWVEQYAQSVGLAASVQPAFVGQSSTATNFAVGGARARDDGRNVNLATQVGAFLQQADGVAAPERLYVIEMGSNDVRDALVVFAGGGNGAAVLQAALTSIAQQISVLYAAGARRFLIWNVPNLALTPAIRQLDAINPGAAQLATALTIAFNTGLNAVLSQLSALPGIDIRRLDAFQTLNDIVAQPAGFGLSNVTAACIMPGTAPFTCDDPDQFLFW
ncbi:MAG: SGNH/GDSL hydrolase family protein, partial [Vicinamibacterales bacterium]